MKRGLAPSAVTIVLGAILVLALAGCGNDGESANFDEDVVDITWIWESLDDEQGDAVTPPNPVDYGVLFDQDGSVAVQADCNRAAGTYEVDGESLTIVLGQTTLAECGPESLYDLYLALLADVVSFSVDEDGLALALADDDRTMRFSG